MGPRRFRRGCAPGVARSVRNAQLQWGRDVSVADVGRHRNGDLAGAQASMGPRRFRRGCLETRAVPGSVRVRLQWGRDVSVADVLLRSYHTSAPYLLQWGRDVSVADVSATRTSAARKATSFNGAATFPSRMFAEPVLIVLGRRCQLQWGRDVSVADVLGSDRAGRSPSAASMGPRRFRRGCRPSSRSPTTRSSFNGAATFPSRMCPARGLA